MQNGRLITIGLLTFALLSIAAPSYTLAQEQVLWRFNDTDGESVWGPLILDRQAICTAPPSTEGTSGTAWYFSLCRREAAIGPKMFCTSSQAAAMAPFLTGGLRLTLRGESLRHHPTGWDRRQQLQLSRLRDSLRTQPLWRRLDRVRPVPFPGRY